MSRQIFQHNMKLVNRLYQISNKTTYNLRSCNGVGCMNVKTKKKSVIYCTKERNTPEASKNIYLQTELVPIRFISIIRYFELDKVFNIRVFIEK